MGHHIFFFSVIFITLVTFSSGKQKYIIDDWMHGIEHKAILRPQAKQIPYLHFFSRSLRANRNLQGSYAKLRIKIVDPFEHLATVSTFAWLVQIDSVNDIIKTMISANIIIS